MRRTASPPSRRSRSSGDSLVGERFGLLRVIDEADPYVWRGQVTHRCWLCRCKCGNETVVRQDALTSGHTTSCGCEKVRVAADTHRRHGARAGGRRSYEYLVWAELREADRAGKLRIPKAWAGVNGFADFIEAVGERPAAGYRLRRVVPRGGRLPEHWGWVEETTRAGTPRWQVRYRGRTMSFRELAEVTGIAYATLLKRFERGRPILPSAKLEPVPVG